jgi:predicted deacylase
MARAIKIGDVSAVAGAYVYGELPVLALPTGGMEALPVVIAAGREPGPILWVTANIHGGEVTGIASIHQLLSENLPSRLRGTLIVLPTINPAGLRVMQRYPYYEQRDPNRVWPAGDGSFGEIANPSIYEQIARRLFDVILETEPACLLDLHNASIDSVPFSIRDRVLYTGDETPLASIELANSLEAIARAFGLSIVNESVPEKYLGQSLHRSVAGSMVNRGGIPSLTVELGAGMTIDPSAVAAGTHGMLNVLKVLGMIDGDPSPITEVPVIDLGYSARRDDSARAPVSGIVQMAVRPGAVFSAGDLLGRMVDLFGRPLPGGDITAPADGWLIGWSNGIAKYQGQVVAALAVRDDAPLICPRPASPLA